MPVGCFADHPVDRVIRQVQIGERVREYAGVVIDDPLFYYLIRRTQVKNVLGAIEAFKLYW